MIAVAPAAGKSGVAPRCCVNELAHRPGQWRPHGAPGGARQPSIGAFYASRGFVPCGLRHKYYPSGSTTANAGMRG